MIQHGFIAGSRISLDSCDDLIDYFEQAPDMYKGAGITGGGLDLSFKKSTDMEVSPTNPDHRVQNYMRELSHVCDDYISLFPYSSEGQATWNINVKFNIQKYKPNEGFYGWHTERDTWKEMNPCRHLAFMTYLNDVTDGGHTEWFHQKLKIQPEKGMTYIWPVDWTHTHRGITSPTQTKYIATGWYSYFVPHFDYKSYADVDLNYS